MEKLITKIVAESYKNNIYNYEIGFDNLELKDDAVLRIGVKGGGCSGMSYLLAFDKKEEGDNIPNTFRKLSE